MSTFHSINLHITFATKHRTPWIKREWIGRLHEYLGGIVRQLDAKPLKIGGVEDHVHLLIGMKPIHPLSDFMRELKRSSSKWVHETILHAPFQWQEGYAAFSVSPPSCSVVARYIANQREHHRKRSFREELISMLDEAGVQYDPQYLE
ncbi:IS200/IS605 family transposase [Allorhodopirellula heiligendammensis]|uniref:Transposase IS200 like protein n=1 Tax=Allorhodopirellula heiligendammensis TaxID=2714739 RepID=A0A5C6BEE5_9BACT|nr:IS200/IS605 family transposase [Allorhodopirellula heiligendammensis]TWU10027.1 Transposase IS200 like protein [Allorhodopirellula heiligendammensis]|tara:strand:+ start:209 stop:652 length:444 start_codon:yes stop_codon:yes gene_type:complete